MDNAMTRLPDPEQYPDIYDGVPLKRLLAWCVDSALIVLFSLLIVPFTAFTAVFFFPALVLVVGFIYRVITLSGGSATPGMRLMAIEMRDARDRPFDFGHALLHTTGYSFSIGTAVVQIVSIVLMATTERGQGLTDLVLGSTALNKRR